MLGKYIRLATHEDSPVLLEIAKKFHEESPYQTLEFSREKGIRVLSNIIGGDLKNSVCLVALKGDEIIGFIFGAAESPVFSNDKIAMELGWFVLEEHRKTRASLLLFHAYEDWAKRVGCKYIQAAFLPGTGTDLSEFYIRNGYSQVESSYLKQIRG